LRLRYPPPAVEGSFEWVVYPEGGIICGKVYTDGSRLDGPSQLLARNVWSFVALDAQGHVAASAHGVTPSWVDDIPGAEAWTVLQAASRAEPGTQYRVDCKPCVDAFHRGRAWATRDKRPLARVHGLMFAALDDTEAGAMVWMPAHTKEADVGRVCLGDGSKLTQLDRVGNDEADRLAKLAVEAHRVPKQVRDRIEELNSVVEKTARWVARATFAAGNQTIKPLRDTEASRAAGAAASRLRAATREAKRGIRVGAEALRPVEKGCKGLARSAPQKRTRTPKWPKRVTAFRRRCGERKGRNHGMVEVERFLPQNLRPLVHALSATERRAALLQRVRAKEAAMRATALPDAVGSTGAVETAVSRCRIPGKRLQCPAGDPEEPSKRRRATR
jgi:hypothetical protein